MSQKPPRDTMQDTSDRYKISLLGMTSTGSIMSSEYLIGMGCNSLKSIITDIVQPVMRSIEQSGTNLNTPVRKAFIGKLPNTGYKYQSIEVQDARPMRVAESTFQEFPVETEYRCVLSDSFIHIAERGEAYTTFKEDGVLKFPASSDTDSVVESLIDGITQFPHGNNDGDTQLVHEYFFNRFHDSDRLDLISITNADLRGLSDEVDDLPRNRNGNMYYELSEIACDIANGERDWSPYRIADKKHLHSWNSDRKRLQTEPDTTSDGVTEPGFFFRYEHDEIFGGLSTSTGLTVVGNTHTDTYKIDTPIISTSTISPGVIEMCDDATTTQETYNSGGVNETGEPVYNDIQTTLKVSYDESQPTIKHVITQVLEDWEEKFEHRVFDQLLQRADIGPETGMTNSPAAFELKAKYNSINELLTATNEELRMQTALTDAQADRLSEVISETK